MGCVKCENVQGVLTHGIVVASQALLLAPHRAVGIVRYRRSIIWWYIARPVTSVVSARRGS